jgi:hypothetical protein
MTPARLARRLVSLFLLIVLMGSLLLSVLSDRWHLALPWHDHIILGPVVPGWENHHHDPLAYPGRFGHSQHGLMHFSGREQLVSLRTDTGVHSKVLSLYRLPEGFTSIFSFGVYLLHSAEGSMLPRLSPFLTWPLSLGFLTLSSTFLPPPDKPPRASK